MEPAEIAAYIDATAAANPGASPEAVATLACEKLDFMVTPWLYDHRFELIAEYLRGRKEPMSDPSKVKELIRDAASSEHAHPVDPALLIAETASEEDLRAWLWVSRVGLLAMAIDKERQNHV